ncbi:molybdenum hydroxylase, partial [bacterium]
MLELIMAIPSVRILLRGGGDLASGVALRLHRAGFQILITELPQPLAVRRLVSFSDAVYSGQTQVEEVTAVLAENPAEVNSILDQRKIPVMVDLEAGALDWFAPHVLIDARMLKQPPELA